MNSFLRPLVHELKQLWDAVSLFNAKGRPVVVRSVLLCVACDIPAARKVSGFVGPLAANGCSRCIVNLVKNDKPYFCNFKRQTWKMRNHEDTLRAALEYCKCKTMKERKVLVKSTGVRYSILNELPYFDMSRMTVIDPMHNLLL